MATALRLAERGLYTTDPNPRVGCVISRDNQVIGRGWHQRAGEAHAEVAAIRDAKASIEGATAYVTLEPCSHHGRTPPCCEALLREKVARVVIAMKDPNPAVAGRGIDYLRKNGVQVDVGLREEAAREINPGFISRMTRGRPWIRVKLAASLDGKTALKNGKSQWITGPAARADVQHWRARSSCVLTGSGTVLADNPSLNARLEGVEVKQPLRAVIDSKARVDASAKLFSIDGDVVVFNALKTNKYNALKNVSLVNYDTGESENIDLNAVVEHLAKVEVNEIHVEAGATLSGALLNKGLIDELIVYQAAVVLGSSGRGLFDLPELTDMQQKIPFVLHDVRRFGGDVRTILRVA